VYQFLVYAGIIVLFIPFLIAGLVFKALSPQYDFYLPIVAATFLGFFLPIAIISIRHQVRLTRVKLIDVFQKTFGISQTNISFEFTRAKYFVDITNDPECSIDQIPKVPFTVVSDYFPLLCSLPFIVFSSFGIFILFLPVERLCCSGLSWLKPSLLAVGGGSELGQAHEYVLTIASFAFAGAFFYCLRLFLRAIAVFDLSALTFLRAFTHLVMATVVAVVLWRVIPNLPNEFQQNIDLVRAVIAPKAQPDAPPQSAPVQDQSAEHPCAACTDHRDKGIPFIWLLIAFTAGFVPDAGLQWLLRKSGLNFKQRYEKADQHSPVVPVTLIDGIDVFMAFRLEEANIFDVQNLAAANPSMLHIETPYGIYQTIDWVAQAQLCTVVGVEKFLCLKRYNIRTIFDLERAVLGESATDGIVQMIGAILFAGNNELEAVLKDYGMSPVAFGGKNLAENLENWIDIDTVKHLVFVMVDDLHVHRLRQIWREIGGKLGRHAELLDRTRRPKSQPENPLGAEGASDDEAREEPSS